MIYVCLSSPCRAQLCFFVFWCEESQARAELTTGRAHPRLLLGEDWAGECAERGREELGADRGMFLSPTDPMPLPSPGPCCELPGSGVPSREGAEELVGWGKEVAVPAGAHRPLGAVSTGLAEGENGKTGPRATPLGPTPAGRQGRVAGGPRGLSGSSHETSPLTFATPRRLPQCNQG